MPFFAVYDFSIIENQDFGRDVCSTTYGGTRSRIWNCLVPGVLQRVATAHRLNIDMDIE